MLKRYFFCNPFALDPRSLPDRRPLQSLLDDRGKGPVGNRQTCDRLIILEFVCGVIPRDQGVCPLSGMSLIGYCRVVVLNQEVVPLGQISIKTCDLSGPEVLDL